MPNILLTGAGFSRNWGGWLADECFEYLLGSPEITSSMKNILWKHKFARTGYEGALQEFRVEYDKFPDDRHKNELLAFESMLAEMFRSMNIGFMNTQFEPGKHQRVGPQPETVRNFLCNFDAIFTLNHDTLLEQKYKSQREGSNGRWAGFETPGLERVKKIEQPHMPGEYFKSLPQPFVSSGVKQPYFKLHGSSNWVQDDGSSILIMGGNKRSNIDKVPLLDWYHSQFREWVCRPHTRLMIIGYSFRDTHIDDLLDDAARKGTKLFIVDPQGTDLLDQFNKTGIKDIEQKDTLFRSIVGASRRPLFTTLTTDDVEFRKFRRFLDLRKSFDY